MQQQALGRNLLLYYLHSKDKFEYAESEITILHYLLKRRLTAPILLPHPTTKCPNFFKKAAAISTSFHYSCPSVM